MSDRAVVIGLDGAAWHLLDPLLAAGEMPRLARLRERGSWGTLTSTVPTYTPPAWTSAVTGVNPGRHGIYGFYGGNAQSEHSELMHAGKIRAPTLWQMANDQSLRAGIYNLPLSYPPRPLDGWMVSGMMTPGFGEELKGFAHPPDLEARILGWAPGYQVDTSANWERDYQDDALCARALKVIEQRFEVLSRLLEQDPVDLVFCVLEAPDRLQHVYYRYLDPAEALYESRAGAALRPALRRCFEAMDRIVGLLDDYAGPQGGALVCSDHGFTSWEVSVHTNALLERWGYLVVKPVAKALQTPAARRLVPLAKRVLPARVAREAKSKTFTAVDWTRTRAFASPIPQQGIFINLAGRERHGIVPPEELDGLAREIADRLVTLEGPDGSPVTDRVYLADDVFEGEERAGAPDVLPVMRDHHYELDDEIFHRQPFTDLSHLPRGVHHPDGIVIVSGPGAKRGPGLAGSVMDVTPTLLYLAGAAVPEGLDGSVLESAFTPEHLRRRPVETTSALSSSNADESSPYSTEEEAAIEESLRGLGYL